MQTSTGMRLRERKRTRTVRGPAPEPTPMTTVVISRQTFAYCSQSGQVFTLPLKEYRTPDGRLCAPLPETGFPEKVTPSHELDLSGPGLHLGSFSLSAGRVQGVVIGGEDAFLDLSWNSYDRGAAGFQVGVVLDSPNGAFSGKTNFATRLGWSREELDGAGISQLIEDALHKVHYDGFVRLFVTLDSAAEPIFKWKARQKAEPLCTYVLKWVDGIYKKVVQEDRTKRPAGVTPVRLSVPLQQSSGKKVFNLHVCLTEKAFKFDAENGTSTGLAKHGRTGGKARTGDKALADVTEALLKRGGGLQLGPDSDLLLNLNPGGGDPRGAEEMPPADLPGILDSIGLPNTAPEAESPEGLLTEPKRYQLQGLAWMMAREGATESGREGADGGRDTGRAGGVSQDAGRLLAAGNLPEKRTGKGSADRVRTGEEVGVPGGVSDGLQTAGASAAGSTGICERLATGVSSAGEGGNAAGTGEAGRESGSPMPAAGRQREGESRNELFLHPCWQQLLTADGQVIYMQREGGTCSPNFYVAPGQGTCGGLLCDEMVRRAFVSFRD